tara:strand:+ start:281 stop:412 length:132 start_codon:yes stop_codon:yes gene_type:complete
MLEVLKAPLTLDKRVRLELLELRDMPKDMIARPFAIKYKTKNE